MVIEAKEQGCKSFILPGENETEGRLVKGIEILPADNLEELCAYLNGAARLEKSKREKKENEKNRQQTNAGEQNDGDVLLLLLQLQSE